MGSIGHYGVGTGFSQINLQDFNPTGTLLISLTQGFIPTNGSSFNLVTYSNRVGQFAGTAQRDYNRSPPLAEAHGWATFSFSLRDAYLHHSRRLDADWRTATANDDMSPPV
jgi:hypothetical protein